MAQTFNDAQQGVIAVRACGASAGSEIVLADSAGNVLLSHTPELAYAVVILSSPDILSGQTYSLSVGTASAQITAD